ELLLLVLELGGLDLELMVLAVELVAALLQGVGHPVERPREPGELVTAADLDAGRQVAGREPVGGGGDAADRRGDGAAEPRGEGEEERDARDEDDHADGDRAGRGAVGGGPAAVREPLL